MAVIKAEEIMVGLKIQDWPNMKKESRSKFHRTVYKAANPPMGEDKIVSGSEMANMIKGLISGRK